MKLAATLIILFLLAGVPSRLFAQTASESRSASGHVETDQVSQTITLHWNSTANTTAFKLYRRSLNSTDWGTAIASLDAATLSYTDTDITEGSVYEYAIERETSTNDPFRAGNIIGYSYVSAGIEVPAKHERGALWLLTTTLINDSLPAEISTLVADLVADGWNVHHEVIDTQATVIDVKALIKDKQSTVGCDAVYLLGHLPVPYSGVYCEDDEYVFPPDGHNETDPNSHCGAWPADAFYGDTEGIWTDEDSTTLAKRDENNNAIGDGKYDQHRIPGKVSIAIGRVDMSDLPLFGLGEVALTKRYLDKVHTYKLGNTALENKGIIENNFASFAEGFSSAALRDFHAICGENGVIQEDVLSAARQKDYLFSYVCGAGSYTSCAGFGTSDSFASNNMAAFNQLFGSFFGDWDIQNNLLRASLATEKLGFTVIWSGRPKWVTHTLAIGESYADVVKKSQNNILDYDAGFYQNGAHMALLGDPSLRIHALKPAKNISAETNDNRDKTSLQWEATEETDILGYYVYRSHRKTGKFEVLTPSPITENTYNDASPYDGTNHYMVRVAKRQETGSGSYINLSLGIPMEINEMKGKIAHKKELSLTNARLYPTVATTRITIEHTSPNYGNNKYFIFNTMGQVVANGTLNAKNTDVAISQFSAGTYFVKANDAVLRFIKQ